MSEKDMQVLQDLESLGYYKRELLKKEAFEEKYKDQPYPENAYEKDGFHYIYTSRYTRYTYQEFLLLKQIKLLSIIKNCALFFTVLTAIGIFIGLMFAI